MNNEIWRVYKIIDKKISECVCLNTILISIPSIVVYCNVKFEYFLVQFKI